MSAIKRRALQRGRLLERISQQRSAFAVTLSPVVGLLHAADQVAEGAEKARRWIGENPLIAGAILMVVVIWRPRGAIKLLKKGAVGWRALRLIRRLVI